MLVNPSEPYRLDIAPPAHGEAADIPDADLVVLAQAGDGEAFGTLYRRYAGRLTGRVINWLRNNGDHRTDANDVVSDAFLRAFEKLHTYQPMPGVEWFAWLAVVARRGYFDALRHRNRGTYRPTLLSLTLTDIREWAGAITDESTERDFEIVEAHADWPVLRAALELLTARQRQVVAHRFIYNYDSIETAALLGVTKGTVCSAAYHAMRVLRDHYLAGATPPAVARTVSRRARAEPSHPPTVRRKGVGFSAVKCVGYSAEGKRQQVRAYGGTRSAALARLEQKLARHLAGHTHN